MNKIEQACKSEINTALTPKEKLAKIYTLYSPERIAKSKERFLLLDKGLKPKDRYPFTLTFPYFGAYDVSHPPKERLDAYLDAFLFLYQFDDDTIPYVFPGLDHATIPSMFGAGEIRSGIETTSEKIIKSISDVYNLPDPSIHKGSAAYKWIEMAKYILNETQGQMPVNVCDMQGPFDSCAQMWSYDEMFMTAYENEDAYNHIISKITDAFGLLWQEQKRILGDAFLGTHLFPQGWVSKDCGVAVSIDSLVMISPDFYQEFYQPHLERMSQIMGDLTIHSCGDFRHVVKNLCNTTGVKAINASQLTAKQLHEAGLDINVQLLLSIDYEDLEEQMNYIKKNNLNVRVCLTGVTPTSNGKNENPSAWTNDDIKEVYEKIEHVKNIMKI